MDRVNLFNPFGLRPDFEDRLTWAFLAALKYDPFLQNFLRELVESRLPSKTREDGNIWEPASVSTQTKWIESSPKLLVSVLLTDECVQEKIDVGWSDREPRYDAVIDYPNGMTLIVENKPHHGNVWEGQLCPSNASFPDGIDDVTLHDSAICLEWSEVLEGVLRYTNSPMPSFGNREIARDFLSFVEEIHPVLTPYRTFRLCGERPEALVRRTNHLVGEIVQSSGLERGWNHLQRPNMIARGIYFDPVFEGEPWRLRVALFPASTAGEADAFLEKIQRGDFQREKFLALNEKGWNVTPNLNFSFFRGQKLGWVSSPCGTEKYLDYFFSGKRPYGKKYEGELPDCIDTWKRYDIIDSKGCEEINRIRVDSEGENRPYLVVNPEFMVYRDWDRDTVMRLEDQGELASHIKEALAAPLKTWGETLDGR